MTVACTSCVPGWIGVLGAARSADGERKRCGAAALDHRHDAAQIQAGRIGERLRLRLRLRDRALQRLVVERVLGGERQRRPGDVGRTCTDGGVDDGAGLRDGELRDVDRVGGRVPDDARAVVGLHRVERHLFRLDVGLRDPGGFDGGDDGLRVGAVAREHSGCGRALRLHGEVELRLVGNRGHGSRSGDRHGVGARGGRRGGRVGAAGEERDGDCEGDEKSHTRHTVPGTPDVTCLRRSGGRAELAEVLRPAVGDARRRQLDEEHRLRRARRRPQLHPGLLQRAVALP